MGTLTIAVRRPLQQVMGTLTNSPRGVPLATRILGSRFRNKVQSYPGHSNKAGKKWIQFFKLSITDPFVCVKNSNAFLEREPSDPSDRSDRSDRSEGDAGGKVTLERETPLDAN